MSSPIHSYLFSPPSSPRAFPTDSATNPNRNLTSLKSLIPFDLLPRPDFQERFGSELKPRSPRTPTQHQFTLDTSVYPVNPNRSLEVPLDLEATPRTTHASPVTPRRPHKRGDKLESPPYLPNVPSTHIPVPSTLPKPLIRLIFFASLILSSILLLVFVPAARLPSLRAASISRRLALAPDGRAYLDVENTVGSWAEARDRDYQPPQIQAGRLLSRRGVVNDSPANSARPMVHPLPESHEILALQSYLLQSNHNVLPKDFDAQKPIDANAVLGVGFHHLGEVGSAKHKLWLEELEQEWEQEIVVWYGGDGVLHHPHKLLESLSATHKSGRHPYMLPCHSRPDLKSLRDVILKHGVDLTAGPVVSIGNKVISGTEEEIKKYVESGELASMLKSIGWIRKTGESKAKRQVTLKQATWKKRDESEIQRAIRKARRHRD